MGKPKELLELKRAAELSSSLLEVDVKVLRDQDAMKGFVLFLNILTRGSESPHQSVGVPFALKQGWWLGTGESSKHAQGLRSCGGHVRWWWEWLRCLALCPCWPGPERGRSFCRVTFHVQVKNGLFESTQNPSQRLWYNFTLYCYKSSILKVPTRVRNQHDMSWILRIGEKLWYGRLPVKRKSPALPLGAQSMEQKLI